MTVDHIIVSSAIVSISIWLLDFWRSKCKAHDAIYVVPIVSWLLHVAVFYGVILWASPEWETANKMLLRDWSKAVVIHNVLTLTFRAVVVYLTRHMV